MIKPIIFINKMKYVQIKFDIHTCTYFLSKWSCRKKPKATSIYEEVRENALNSMSGDTNVFMKFMHWILSYRIISFKSFGFFFNF